MSAFVDSSVWFAAAAKRDARNERAKSILLSIDQHLTTDLVLVETWQLLKAQFDGELAENFWERLRDAGVRIEPVVAADLEAAWEINRNCREESFSFVDRTSFVLMERVGVTQAATFNPDFAAYRLGSSKRAFQILSEGHGQTFLALKQALLERRPVRRSHDGERQTVCPISWATPPGRSAHSPCSWRQDRARSVRCKPGGSASDSRRSWTFTSPMSPG
ncbi:MULTISPECIES: type II toxin-antitoxin system VapC family toxin [unclassified Bradyrhizobium]|uniref:Ribonuclease VapC n=1 Tax=Bradyrhizobium sp. LLZ17 TaxID=3239388 RepID=A0AB39XQV9_9BRAD